MNFEKLPASDFEKPKESIIDKVRKKIQERVNESRLPSVDYESTVGVYGGRLVFDNEDKLVYNTTGFVSKVDRKGDAVLRTFDEHLVKEPWKLLKNHPKWFFKFLTPGPKRYRGTPDEIMESVEKLGLSDYYGLHKDGIEIKKPEIYTRGIDLQDIYRADLIGSSQLNEIDREKALSKASEYIKKIHDERGGIGELVVGDIIFQENEENQVKNPVLNLPDIIYSKEKNIGEKEKKATDLLDFLASIGTEEFRRSRNWRRVEKSIKIILENYGDQEVIKLTNSFVKRGRLTLQGDIEMLNLPDTLTTKTRAVFAQHNKARLGSGKDFEGQLKQIIVKACEEFYER